MATMKLGSKSEVFRLEGQTWLCTNDLQSDVVIQIGEISFHLHKGDEIPGGAKGFELAAKFCYDVKIELNAHNVVYVRCAAEHLRMTEDYVGGNLIVQAENFLNEVFGSWKDSIKALETCEDVLPQAEDLHVVSRCINSMAAKASADPPSLSWPMAWIGRTSTNNSECSVPWNGITAGDMTSSVGTEWWFEDVSFLSLSLYKRLILAMESKGMKPENIAGSLMFYARKHLLGLGRNASFRDVAMSASAPSESDQRNLLEEISQVAAARERHYINQIIDWLAPQGHDLACEPFVSRKPGEKGRSPIGRCRPGGPPDSQPWLLGGDSARHRMRAAYS